MFKKLPCGKAEKLMFSLWETLPFLHHLVSQSVIDASKEPNDKVFVRNTPFFVESGTPPGKMGPWWCPFLPLDMQ
jgi:hypothetical protein